MSELIQTEKATNTEIIEPTLPQAVKVLANAMHTDPDYFNVWQANIAMIILDEFNKIKEERGVELAVEDINGIASRGARNFLNLFKAASNG